MSSIFTLVTFHKISSTFCTIFFFVLVNFLFVFYLTILFGLAVQGFLVYDYF